MLFESVMVIGVYAPDSGKDLWECEKFPKDATKHLQEGRRTGAEDFNITRDLNIELGLLCTGDADVEELREMYGPQCWLSCEVDPGGFQKNQWTAETTEAIMKSWHLSVIPASANPMLHFLTHF